MRPMKTLLFALLLASGSVHAAQPDPLPMSACVGHVPYGIPEAKKVNTVPICRDGYFTLNDVDARIPLYVSYLLTPTRVQMACNTRDGSFEADASLPADKRATPKDYAKSGYDIGHMVPAEDLKYSEEAQYGAAILSNAAPQLPSFNRGIWKKLEDTTRGWTVSRDHPVLVYAGPIYDKQDTTIGKNMVVVPSAFFKILIDTKTSEVQVFLLRHEGSKEKLETFNTSLAEVQRQTGIVLPMPKNPKYGSWPIALKTAKGSKTCALR